MGTHPKFAENHSLSIYTLIWLSVQLCAGLQYAIHSFSVNPSHTDLSFIPHSWIMLKSCQILSHQLCVLLWLHKHDNANLVWLHVLHSLGPDFISLLKIFPPHCSEWRLRSGNALPHTPPSLGTSSDGGMWQALEEGKSASSTPSQPPNPPCHAQLILGIYRGEMWALGLTLPTPYVMWNNMPLALYNSH